MTASYMLTIKKKQQKKQLYALKDLVSLFKCCCIGDTHGLWNVLVYEALEMSMLVHAVHHRATLWFYPTFCHQVKLCVHVHSFHLCVIVIIRRKARVPGRFQ